MNEKTEWKGLWRNRAGVYSGQVLKKADIPKYARLIVRKNRFYDADSNRPMFVYTFAQGEASDAITIENYAVDMYTEEEVRTIVQRVVKTVIEEMEYGESPDDIIVEHRLEEFNYGMNKGAK